MSLPQPPALAKAGGLILAPLEFPPLRVLIVDDNADAADSLGTLLGMVGFVTRVCYDAESAAASVETFRPEACVLDVSMPGTDGCELARSLRAREGGREMLLVAVTALGGDAARERTAGAGFDLHLTKPADPQQLADALFAFERKLRVN